MQSASSELRTFGVELIPKSIGSGCAAVGLGVDRATTAIGNGLIPKRIGCGRAAVGLGAARAFPAFGGKTDPRCAGFGCAEVGLGIKDAVLPLAHFGVSRATSASSSSPRASALDALPPTSVSHEPAACLTSGAPSSASASSGPSRASALCALLLASGALSLG